MTHPLNTGTDDWSTEPGEVPVWVDNAGFTFKTGHRYDVYEVHCTDKVLGVYVGDHREERASVWGIVTVDGHVKSSGGDYATFAPDELRGKMITDEAYRADIAALIQQAADKFIATRPRRILTVEETVFTGISPDDELWALIAKHRSEAYTILHDVNTATTILRRVPNAKHADLDFVLTHAAALGHTFHAHTREAVISVPLIPPDAPTS